eukprot:g52818.t1
MIENMNSSKLQTAPQNKVHCRIPIGSDHLYLPKKKGIQPHSTTNAMTSKTPSEFQPTKKWEQCAENAILKISTGMLIGGAASLVLMSSPRTRIFAFGFSGGIGAGISWADCSRSWNSKVPPTVFSFKSFMDSFSSLTGSGGSTKKE